MEEKLYDWDDAKILMLNNYIMAAEHFSYDQSIHMYHGVFYLEDGAMFDSCEENRIEWVKPSKYRIVAEPKDINKEEYNRLHEYQNKRHLMLTEPDSYQNAFTKTKGIDYNKADEIINKLI